MQRVGSILWMGILATVAVILLTPFWKIHAIRGALAAADTAGRAGDPRRAEASLLRVEPWSYRFPALAFDVNRALIRAWALDGRTADARARAEWIRSTPGIEEGLHRFTTPATGHWETLEALPAAWAYRLATRDGRVTHPLQYDPLDGYRVLIQGLVDRGDREAAQVLLAAHPTIATRQAAARPVAPTPPPAPAPPPATAAGDRSRVTLERINRVREFDTRLQADARDADARRDRDALLPQIGPAWGIVKVDAAQAFSVASVRERRAISVGRVPEGTAVDILEFLAPGAMTLVRASVTGADAMKDVVLRLQDLAVRPGALAGVPADERRLWVQAVRLQNALAQAREAAGETSQAGGSSEYAAYKTAHEAYTDYYARMKKLIDDEKSGKGNADLIRDELRRMKYDQPHVNETYRAARDRYMAWREQNPVQESPQVRELVEQLAQLKQRLDALQR
jgi:hypothetical protein